MEPLLTKDRVKNLIPQKEPFVMGDTLFLYEEGSLTTGFTIPEEHIFTDNGKFTESGLVEHMAQSVALYTGYQYFLKNEEAPTGYIGSVKDVEILELPNVGDELVTEAKILQEFMGITLVDIITKKNERKIASAQMKTVLAK